MFSVWANVVRKSKTDLEALRAHDLEPYNWRKALPRDGVRAQLDARNLFEVVGDLRAMLNARTSAIAFEKRGLSALRVQDGVVQRIGVLRLPVALTLEQPIALNAYYLHKALEPMRGDLHVTLNQSACLFVAGRYLALIAPLCLHFHKWRGTR